MLNLDETLELYNDYILQRDAYIKSILYSTGTITFLDIIRQQVPEINLLQLVPGFYLFLLFTSFLFLVFFSDFFISITIEIENVTSFGTKTITKVVLITIIKLSLLSFLLTLYLSFISVIPLSLDSFNSYGEKTLENIWSFGEVINLELILIIILILLSQVPVFILGSINLELDAQLLPKFWKLISIVIFITSGFLTPTIDGYTQLGFSSFGISFYLIIINFLLKKITTKYNGNSILGF
jgi:hypothetical protein